MLPGIFPATARGCVTTSCPFTDGKTEAQKGSGSCPGSPSQQVAEQGPELESVSFSCSGMDQLPAILVFVFVFLEGVLWGQMSVESASREQHF